MKTLEFDIAVFQDDGLCMVKVPAIPQAFSVDEDAQKAIHQARTCVESYILRAAQNNRESEIIPVDLDAVKNDPDYANATWQSFGVDPRLLYKNSKRERRERHPFNLGFFTRGTVCEVEASKSKIVTVHRVVKNGPDSYCITTGEIGPHTEVEEGFNISWVKRIIQQVPGHVEIDQAYNRRYRDEYFKREHARDYNSLLAKHPSQYCTSSLEELIGVVADDYLSGERVLNVQSLSNALIQQGVVKVKEYVIDAKYGWTRTVYTANKKKFRQAVRRLVGRHLLSPAKAQKQNDADDARWYDDLD